MTKLEVDGGSRPPSACARSPLAASARAMCSQLAPSSIRRRCVSTNAETEALSSKERPFEAPEPDERQLGRRGCASAGDEAQARAICARERVAATRILGLHPIRRACLGRR